MFKRKIIASFLLALAANGFTANQSPLDRFSFDYSLQGDARAKPLQVFDDGTKTYLQYRSIDDIPAFISARDGVLLIPRQEGPYTVLSGVPRDFIAQMGNARARITHSSAMSNAPQYQRGSSPISVPTDRVNVAALGLVPGSLPTVPSRGNKNDWTDNSYAQPLKGDQIAWGGAETEVSRVFTFERGSAKFERDTLKRLKQLAAEIGSSKRVVISSSDDTHPADVGGSERARVVRNALVASGVSPSAITVHVGFLFDEQLTRNGTKLYNPTSVTWTVQASPARLASRTTPDDTASILEGLKSGRITAAQAVEQLKASRPEQPKGTTSWSVRRADQDIERMLGRWAADSGWKVIWKGAPSVQITGDAERPLNYPDFLQAADYVISQARSSGYRIKAVAYSNQVLVVTGE